MKGVFSILERNSIKIIDFQYFFSQTATFFQGTPSQSYFKGYGEKSNHNLKERRGTRFEITKFELAFYDKVKGSNLLSVTKLKVRT